MKKLARSGRRQRGLATVEMALVTPVLLIILLVTFEFTRAFYQQNTLTKSVRDAARLLSLNGFKGSKFELTALERSNAINLAVYGNIAGSGSPVINGLTTANFNVNTRLYASGATQLEHVEVRAEYDFQPLWPIIRNMNFLSTNVDITPTSASSRLRLRAVSRMRALK